MIVGVVRLDLRLYDCHSLKQKRSVVNRLLQRLRTKFPISVAEVGSLDLLKRALLGATLVAGEEKLVQSVFSALEKELEYAADVEIINQDVEILHYGEKLD
jgi:uncharacterized protein YlxP (DUF503 family)